MNIIPKFKGGALFADYDLTSTYSTGKTSTKTTTKSSSSSSSKSTSDSDKGLLTEKMVYEAMGDMEGLPGELNQFYRQMKAVVALENITGKNPLGLGNQYLDSKYQIALMKFNKDMWNSAYEDAKKDGSLQEAAITTKGNLVVKRADSPELHEVTLEQFNPETDKMLSNADLLQMRKMMPSMKDNSSIFDTVNNGMSFSKFQALLNSAKNTLGSNSYSETGLAGKEALKGLQTLNNLSEKDREAVISNALNGVYSYETSSTANVESINALVTYLKAALPKNAKVWAAVTLKMKDEDAAAQALVGRYLASGKVTDTKYNVKFLDTAEHLTHEDEKQKAEQEKKDNILNQMNTPTKWVLGYGSYVPVSINIGDTHETVADGITMPFTDREGKYLGLNSSLSDALSGEYNTVLNIYSVSMGNAYIDPSAFTHVVLGDGKITSIDFPCIHDADGRIRPDLSPETREKKKKARQQLQAMGINPDNQKDIAENFKTINQVYEQNKLAAPYDANGNINNQTWCRFGVATATTDQGTLGESASLSLLTQVKDDAKADNLTQIIQGYDKNFELHGWGPWEDDYYSGLIWIPVTDSVMASTANQKLSSGTMKEISAREQAANRNLLNTRQVGQ